MTTTLREDLAKLRQLKRETTKANRAAALKTAEMKEHQRRCLDRMEAEGFTGKVEFDGTPYTPNRDKDYASVQDKGLFISWALENAPHLVTTEPSKSVLNTLVRNALDDGHELPPGIGYYNQDYIAVGGLREDDE